jgi:uncharacterized membrane protein YheB (UPF0754 family)
MLFKPHRELKIFRFRLQGVLPRRQASMAEAIGEAIERELIRKEDIISMLSNIGKDKISSITDTIIDEKLRLYKLNSIYFVDKAHKKLLEALKSFVKREVISTVYSGRHLGGNLTDTIDIRSLVTERIKGFSTHELEKATFSLMGKELRFVEIMGAVIGFFIGIFQVVLLIL